MLGLIKKDLFVAKGNLKTLIIILIVFSLMAINGNENFLFIPSFMSIMIMTSTFSYDEYNKTDAFIISIPNGKRNAVKAKYLATLLIILIFSILTLIISILIGKIENNLNIQETFETLLGCNIGIILVQSVFYPFIYKFGIEKSRIGIFIVIVGISSLATILMKNGISLKINPNLMNIFTEYYFLIIPIFLIIIIFISYKISVHNYLKKEF